MKSLRNPRFRIWTIMISVALLLIATFPAVAISKNSLSQQSDPNNPYYVPDAVVHELLAAEKRWAGRTFFSYWMDIEGNCEQSLEVRNEKIVMIYANTCSKPGVTISNLFAIIEHDMTTIEWLNDIGCDLMVIYPTYNPSWGYPEKIEYHQESVSRSNLNEATYNKFVPSEDRLCPAVLYGKDGYYIKSFMPIFQETF